MPWTLGGFGLCDRQHCSPANCDKRQHDFALAPESGYLQVVIRWRHSLDAKLLAFLAQFESCQASVDSSIPNTHDESVAITAATAQAKSRQTSAARYRSDLVSFGWWSIAVGTILAAGIYPLMLSVVGLSVHCAKCLIYGFNNSPFTATEWFWVFLFVPAFCIGCLFWVGAITAVLLPMVHVVVRSLDVRLSFIRLGAFTGGFLILGATIPISLDWPRIQRNDGWSEVARVILMGPAAATFVGQIGGAYGGLRATRRAANWAQARQELVERGWRQPSQPERDGDAGRTDALANLRRFRFRIAHLLWIAAWVSVLLAFIRLIGIPFETILPVVFGWLLYQSLTLWLGGITVRRLAPWWNRWRQGRST